MPLGFRPLDLIVIFVIGLLVFGPKKLPEMGRSIAQGIQMFKKGMSEVTGSKDETPAAHELVSASSPTRERPRRLRST